MNTIEIEVAQFMEQLDAAIASTMRGEVADATKKVIANRVYTDVYDAYEPEFYSRRSGVGGLADPDDMEANYDERSRILEVSDTAPNRPGEKWQQLWGGHYPDSYLAEAVEEGKRQFNMHLAGPRPFHELAEQDMDSTGAFEAQLRAGLAKRGF